MDELHELRCSSPEMMEEWNVTSNVHFQQAMAGVQEQMKDMGLWHQAWSPVENRSISLCAILMNEAVGKPQLILQEGDFHHSFRHSLGSGGLEGFDYDSYQSAAELCVANGCTVAAPVLAIVVTRFKLHCQSAWPLAVRFQSAYSHFSYSSMRLALFEESMKVYTYWLLRFVSDREPGDQFADVFALMHEHWFGTTVVPQQSLEVRAHYLSGGTNKNRISSISDVPSCLLLTGLANLLGVKGERAGSSAAKRRKTCRFELYQTVARALGVPFEDFAGERKPTIKDANRALTEEKKQGIYARIGFGFLEEGAPALRFGMMPPGVRPESDIGSPMDGVNQIMQILSINCSE